MKKMHLVQKWFHPKSKFPDESTRKCTVDAMGMLPNGMYYSMEYGKIKIYDLQSYKEILMIPISDCKVD